MPRPQSVLTDAGNQSLHKTMRLPDLFPKGNLKQEQGQCDFLPVDFNRLGPVSTAPRLELDYPRLESGQACWAVNTNSEAWSGAAQQTGIFEHIYILGVVFLLWVGLQSNRKTLVSPEKFTPLVYPWSYLTSHYHSSQLIKIVDDDPWPLQTAYHFPVLKA